MDFYFPVILAINLLLLLIMFITIKKNLAVDQNYKRIAYIVLSLITVDSISEFIAFLTCNIPEYRNIYSLFTSLSVFLTPIIPCALFHAINKNAYKKLYSYISIVITIILMSQGLVFEISGDNGFSRGRGFLLYIGCFLLSVVILLVQSGKLSKKYQNYNNSTLFLVGILFVLILMVQVIFPKIHIARLGITLSVLLFFIYNNNIIRQIDSTTGLLSRSSLDFCIKEKANKFDGIIIMDFNGFKKINDTYGHLVGDNCLSYFGKSLIQVYGKVGTCYRYGGDEFCVLIKKGYYDRISELKGKLELVLKSNDKLPQPLEFSYGLVKIENDIDFIDAVKIADEKMYADKFKNVKSFQETVNTFQETVNTSKKNKNITNKINEAHAKILIVDDSEINRELLSEILSDEYNIINAKNGEEAIEILNEKVSEISVVLLDIIMPVKDGFSVLEYMNKTKFIEDVPVVIISSESDSEVIKKAYKMGVSDYINRPFDSYIVKKRVSNTMLIYAKQRKLEDMVLATIKKSQKIKNMMVDILSHIVEFRNAESGLHITSIMTLTELILENFNMSTNKYNFSKEEILEISQAAALHDIGKISIPDEILNKPDKLTKEEFEIMKSHTIIGADIIKSLSVYEDEPFLKTVYDICKYHHERYDGKGYPEGLSGDDIPISAQVVSISDAYDALTSERCYKKAYDHGTAVKMILNGECGAFNPLLLKCFADVEKEFEERK